MFLSLGSTRQERQHTWESHFIHIFSLERQDCSSVNCKRGFKKPSKRFTFSKPDQTFCILLAVPQGLSDVGVKCIFACVHASYWVKFEILNNCLQCLCMRQKGLLTCHAC